MEVGRAEEGEVERLPVDLLAHIFMLLPSFADLAQATGVSRKWREGALRSLAVREHLSFAGYKMNDDSAARVVQHAYNLRDLDMYVVHLFVLLRRSHTPSLLLAASSFYLNKRSRSCWGCQITDHGLHKISLAKCIGNLTSISLWGMAGITDKGVVQLVSKAKSLQHLNIGGTFITDESLLAIANSCPYLKSLVLWCCRHVTERGLFVLVNKCRRLESINVWGMRVPVNCLVGLLAVSPALQIKPASASFLLAAGAGAWPVVS